MSKTKNPKADKPVSLERRRRVCTICGHENCAEIEADFVEVRGKPAGLFTQTVGATQADNNDAEKIEE